MALGSRVGSGGPSPIVGVGSRRSSSSGSRSIGLGSCGTGSGGTSSSRSRLSKVSISPARVIGSSLEDGNPRAPWKLDLVTKVGYVPPMPSGMDIEVGCQVKFNKRRVVSSPTHVDKTTGDISPKP
jgi:hypothetical protein